MFKVSGRDAEASTDVFREIDAIYGELQGLLDQAQDPGSRYLDELPQVVDYYHDLIDRLSAVTSRDYDRHKVHNELFPYRSSLRIPGGEHRTWFFRLRLPDGQSSE